MRRLSGLKAKNLLANHKTPSIDTSTKLCILKDENFRKGLGTLVLDFTFQQTEATQNFAFPFCF